MTVRELVTSWGFDIDEKPLKQMDSHIKTIKKSIEHVTFVAAGAVAGIFGIAATTAAFGEEISKTAQKVGMGTAKIQELQYAANLLGDVAGEDLTVGLKFLSSSIYDAANGSGEAQKKFSALNVSFKNADGSLRSADEVLMAVSDKFQKMPDGVKKTSLSVDLLGRSGINMIPFLNKGSVAISGMAAEAHRLGMVMSDEAIKNSQDFMDGMKRMKAMVTGVKNEIGASLLPVLNDLISKFSEWFMANRAIISQAIKKTISELVFWIGKLLKFTKEMAVYLGGVIKSLGGFEKVMRAVIKSILIFTGIKVAYALGGIVFSIINTAKAFAVLGNAALLAQLKILAIPAAIVAGVAVLYLLLDDLVAFFQGRDSLFGRAIEEIKKRFPEAFSFITDLFGNFISQIQFLGNVFSVIFGWLTRINGKLNDTLKPMVDYLKIALEGWSRLLRVSGAWVGDNVRKGAGAIQTNAQDRTGFFQNASSSVRGMNESAQTPSYRNSPRNYVPGGHVDIKPSVNITVHGGLTNEQTGGVVADAVSKIFEGILSDSQLDFARAIER